MVSNNAEPTSSYKYFDGSSLCPGLVRLSRTSAANADTCRSDSDSAGVAMGSPVLRLGLVLDATECCVDIRIMRLEPISERPPQHARGGARRAALHHIVLAVKEICRVTRVERHGSESRKRCELRSRPFPSVSHQIMHTKGTRACGMCAHRRGIPRFEIEVSPGRARRFLAPGIAALP